MIKPIPPGSIGFDPAGFDPAGFDPAGFDSAGSAPGDFDPAPGPDVSKLPMRATALLALWNEVDPGMDDAYNNWHGIEHVPERCTVPGILWGRRYRAEQLGSSPCYLTLYGLRDPQVLESQSYQRLLREPTPASRLMRPALRNVSRWVCRLDQGDDPGGTAGLVVFTMMGPTRPDPVIDAFASAFGADTLVVGERLMDVAPLPWLAGAQEQVQEGGWLVCAVARDGNVPFRENPPTNALPAGATVYSKLPVG